MIDAAAVWWPRAKYKTSEAELSKLQRMVCMEITGAMRMTPTVTIKVVLGLPPCICSWTWRPKQEFRDQIATSSALYLQPEDAPYCGDRDPPNMDFPILPP
jgi:hypothetical protein